MTDHRKVYAALHKALTDAENNNASHHLFGELSWGECLVAHHVLMGMDEVLRARWIAEGEAMGHLTGPVTYPTGKET